MPCGELRNGLYGYKKKPLRKLKGFFVAEAGLEPTTFGL